MKRISYYVVGVHIFIFLWMALWMPAKKVQKQPLQVRTVIQAPELKKTAATTQMVSASKPKPTLQKPKPKKVATKKKAPIKRVPVKSTPAKARPVKKKPAIPDNLMQELQESIAKIEKNSHKESPKKTLQAPKRISDLKVDQEISGEESVFTAALVQRLQSTLDLPEKGAVKVELTLKSDGTFAQMRVLESKSERNQKFLEQELPTLKFPTFSGHLKNEKEHAFVITFCNS